MDFFKVLAESFGQVILNLNNFWNVFEKVWFAVLPGPFYFLFKYFWMKYVQRKYIRSIISVLLEIVPPREIETSPKPMESIFHGIAGVLKTFNPLEEYIKGNLTPYFSLEMVSLGGSVHLYVRTPVAFRNLVEAHVYAQYPNAEILEVPDYVESIPKMVPNKDWDLWGTDFELTKPDAYPIKTYKYFDEDITGEMVDPLSALLEALGKAGPNDQLWFQIMIQPLKEDWGGKFGKPQVDILAGRDKKKESVLGKVWQDLVDVLTHIVKAMIGPVEFEAAKEEKTKEPLEFRLTPIEKDVLKAVETNIGKYVFKTKMRFLYLGKRETFDKAHVSTFIGGLKQFADLNLNGFKPNDDSKTYANFVMTESRLRYRQRKIFRRYKDRDADGAKFVLSSEELATVFHFPFKTVSAPAIARVESRRGGAPINLPIE